MGSNTRPSRHVSSSLFFLVTLLISYARACFYAPASGTAFLLAPNEATYVTVDGLFTAGLASVTGEFTIQPGAFTFSALGIPEYVGITAICSSYSTGTASFICTPGNSASYTVTCSGAVYSSSPPPGSTIVLYAPPGSNAATTVTISNIGTGPLIVDFAAPFSSSWASLDSGLPIMSLSWPGNGGPTMAPFTITCTTPASPMTPQSTSVLSLSTDDPHQTSVSYTITCDSVGPVYQSVPAVGSLIDFSAISTPASTTITVSDIGLVTLTAMPSTAGSWFSVSPALLSIPASTSNTIVVTCTPPTSGLVYSQTSSLQVMTNEHTGSPRIYTLQCARPVPIYTASPLPSSTIAFNHVTSTLTQLLFIWDTGVGPLSVSQTTPLFQVGSWFSIPAGLPISSLATGVPAIGVPIKCSPPFGSNPATLYTDTLTLATNDPGQPIVTYTLTCSAAPAYSSVPAASSTIAFGPVTPSASKTLSISNNGVGSLSVSQSVPFAVGSWFSVTSGLSITTLNQGSPAVLVSIKCTPPSGSNSATPYTDTLTLTTSDPSQSTVTYSLTCSAAPVFIPTPAPSSTIAFGWVTSTAFKSISILNSGVGTLSASQSGSFAVGSWFSINSGLPLSGFTQGSPAALVSVKCAPPNGSNSAIPYTDTLTLLTNDPSQPTVHYTLTCSAAPVYSSTPVPSSTIAFGSVATTGSQTISILNSGVGALSASQSPLFTAGSWFSVSSGTPIFGFHKGAPALVVSITCAPPIGTNPTTLFVDTLTLSINDPAQPTAHYTLTCSAASVYSSTPAPSSTIAFGSVISTSSTSISISNNGAGFLNSMQSGSLAVGSWFSVTSGLPIAGLNEGPSMVSVSITCAPPIGTNPTTLFVDTLTLSTNDLMQPTVHYTLTCSAASVYSSTPAPSSTIAFGSVTSTSSMSISISNNGVGFLRVAQSGSLAVGSWFSVTSGLPISSLNEAAPAAVVVVRCLPPIGSSAGPYTDTLTLSTNDVTQPTVHYSLTCSAASVYSSTPAPSSTITFGSVASTSSMSISISNNGVGFLSVTQLPSFSFGSWFSIASGLPISSLNEGVPAAAVSITCSPPIGSNPAAPYMETLTLSTNDPMQPSASYTLKCSAAPVYSSTPAPSSTIAFGSVASTSSMVISISNNGVGSLSVTQSGPLAIGSWFSISASLPISNLSELSPGVALSIACSPPIGADPAIPYTDTLTLSSNDPVRSSVSYTLACSAAPVYSSTPVPSSLIGFGWVTSTSQKTISISNTGVGFLSVRLPSLGTASWFSIVSGLPVMNLNKPSPAVTVSIQCSPPIGSSPAAVHSENLVLPTNDPSQPTVSYTLTCMAAPIVTASPASLSTLSFGSISSSAVTTISIANSGVGSLSISQESAFAVGSWFSVSSGLPLNGLIEGAPPAMVSILCSPPIGSTPATPNVDTLVLLTNDPSSPMLSYTLTCSAVPAFSSTPAPSSTVAFGADTGPKSITISISNNGVGTLSASQSGSLAVGSWFSISSGLPLNGLNEGSPAVAVSITCSPPIGSDPVAQYTDTLTLLTNDPSQPIVHYTLTCSAAPVYSSTPAPGSTISFGTVTSITSMSISISNNGVGFLRVDPSGSLAVGSWFSLSSGLPITDLDEGSPMASVSITCLPPISSNPAIPYMENITLSTNDPTQPIVYYMATCSYGLVFDPFASVIRLPPALPSSPSSSLITVSNLSPTPVANMLLMLQDSNVPPVFSVSNNATMGNSNVMTVASMSEAGVTVMCTAPSVDFGVANATLVVVEQADPLAVYKQYALYCPSIRSSVIVSSLPGGAGGSYVIAIPPSFVFEPSDQVSVNFTNTAPTPVSVTLQPPAPGNPANGDAQFSAALSQVSSSSPVISPLSLVLPGGQTAQLQVSCVASVVGDRSTSLTVTLANATQLHFTVICTGLASLAVFPSESVIDFGGLPVGSSAATKDSTVQNLSPSWLTLTLSIATTSSGGRSTSLPVAGGEQEHQVAPRDTAQEASVSSAGALVSVTPTVLVIPPHGMTQFSVQVLPLAIGAGQATLLVQGPTVQQGTPLRQVVWVGESAVLALEPEMVVLQSVTVNGAPGSAQVSVSNAGNIDLSVQVSQLIDENTDVFSLEFPSGASLQRWQTVPANAKLPLVTIHCVPPSTTTFKASLLLQSSDVNQLQVLVPLTCIGTATCSDGVKNQDETSIDCGGSVCRSCQALLPPGSLLPPTVDMSMAAAPQPVSVLPPPAAPLGPTPPGELSGSPIPVTVNSSTIVVLDGSGHTIAVIQLPPGVDPGNVVVTEPSPSMVEAANQHQPNLASGSVIDLNYVVNGTVRDSAGIHTPLKPTHQWRT